MRTYVKPDSIAIIRFEVRKILAERREAGQRPPTNRQLAEWLGYSVKAIVQARKAA